MATKPVKVQVKAGILVGEQVTLENDFKFNWFKGVPYAQPPVGKLRFQPPVPIERFATPEIDCTKEGSMAVQTEITEGNKAVGSEDCLFMNIYAPVALEPNEQLPVWVYLHGGAHWFGDSNSTSVYPEFLMQERMLVVTFNYRLGAFGFLCVPKAGIYGNMGLKDQRLVLQWIQENISSFNGDPSRVLVHGESSAAGDAQVLLLDEVASKTFHRVILSSGVINSPWFHQKRPLRRARNLAASLGCKSRDDKNVVEFLTKADAYQIAVHTNNIIEPEDGAWDLPSIFKPVIEDADSPDKIISLPSFKALRRYNKIRIPVMLGYNSGETLMYVSRVRSQAAKIDKNIGELIPANLPIEKGTSLFEDLVERVKKFYFVNGTLTPDQALAVAYLIADTALLGDQRHGIQFHLTYQPNSPLFYYRFDYSGGNNIFKKWFHAENLPGAAHSDERGYIYQIIGESSKLSEEDVECSKRLVRIFANFARHGHPTPNGPEEPLIDFNWLPIKRPENFGDKPVFNYLDMGKKFVLRTDPDKERSEFWQNIYDLHKPLDYSLMHLDEE